jgi:predicted Zn-dependent protease
MGRRRAEALAALTAAAVTAATCVPAVRGTLLQWDDRSNLVENHAYRGLSLDSIRYAFTTFHLGPWQPLSWLSWTLDDAVWGGDPRGFYVTNVLLQSLCAALLALLAARLLARVVPALGERPALLGALAAVASLLWAAHPQRVESVAWATERRDVLSCAFLLASALAWDRYAGTPRAADGTPPAPSFLRSGAWWAAFLLFAGSLLSKATAMGFVLVLVVLDWHPYRRALRAHLAEKVPFALAGLAVAALAWIGQRSTDAALTLDDVSPLARVVVAGATVTHHLFATVLPLGLRAHVQRPAPEEMLRADLVAGAAAAVAIAVAAFVLRRRFPSVAAALAAYLVLLAPVSGLALTGSHLWADRYSHQPTLALGLLVAGGAGLLLVRRPPPLRPAVVLLVLGAAVATYASAAFNYASKWRDPRTLWGNVLAHEPENWVAHEQLAKDAFDAGDLALAEAHLIRSLASKPSRLAGTKFLATVQVKLGKLDDAERTIGPVLEHVPDDEEALRIAGMIAERRGDRERALELYRKSLALAPDRVATLQALGEVLLGLGRTAEAEEVARRIVERTPNDPAAHVFLGSLVGGRGDAAEAERLFREAVRLDPDSALALRWLGTALAKRGETKEGETHLRRALEIDASDAETWSTLATVVAQRGDAAGAVPLALRAVELLPGHPAPRLQAATLLLETGRREEARQLAESARRLAQRAGDTATVERANALLLLIDGR